MLDRLDARAVPPDGGRVVRVAHAFRRGGDAGGVTELPEHDAGVRQAWRHRDAHGLAGVEPDAVHGDCALDRSLVHIGTNGEAIPDPDQPWPASVRKIARSLGESNRPSGGEETTPPGGRLFYETELAGETTSPRSAPSTATAARLAVSVRRIRGPRPATSQPSLRACSTSDPVSPPSGPTSSAMDPGRPAPAARTRPSGRRSSSQRQIWRSARPMV